MLNSSTSHSQRSKRRFPACNECARRKIRCDRSIPCSQCLQRDLGSLCSQVSSVSHRPIIRGPLFDADFAAEILQLREKNAHLEVELAHLRRSQKNLDSNHTVALTPTAALASQAPTDLTSGLTSDDEVETLQITVENINLGIHRDSKPPPQNLRSEPGRPSPSHPLPSRRTSTKLVRFALTQLSWIHCALRASLFFEEHERFWTNIETYQSNPYTQNSWVALYFAVLSTAAYYVDASDDCLSKFSFFLGKNPCLTAISQEYLISISARWYRASLEQLEASDFLGKPRLLTIQTVAVLMLPSVGLGQTDREWTMLGAIVNMARCLKLDTLGREQSHSRAVEQIPDLLTSSARGLGRRLWWTLVLCDWLGFPNRPATIDPETFDTVLELEQLDDDIVLSPTQPNTPSFIHVSSLHYRLEEAKLARVMYNYSKRGAGSHVKNFAAAIQEVEMIHAACPIHLKSVESNVGFEQNLCELYPWLPYQRHLFTHIYHFTRLTIARSHFSLWMLRQPDPHNLHAKAIESAEALVRAKQPNQSPMYQKGWLICVSTVAAGVFLCLELLCFGTGADAAQRLARRTLVQTCILALESMEEAKATSRKGSTILRRLLRLEETWDHKWVPGKEILQKIIQSVTTHSESLSNDPFAVPALHETVSFPLDATFGDLSAYSLMGDEGATMSAWDDAIWNTVDETVEFSNSVSFNEPIS